MYLSSVYYRLTATANVPIKVGLQNKTVLSQIRAVKEGGGAYNLLIYSRAFAGNAIPIQLIREHNGGSVTRLEFFEQHELRVGDTVTVASASVAGYNTDHIVTAVPDAYTVVTDQTYSADSRGGTGTLAIPTAVQPVFEILESTAAGSGVVRWHGERSVVNMDVVVQRQNPHFAYVVFTADGVYHLVLTAGTDMT